MSYTPPAGGGAPTAATYITTAADPTLSAEALLSAVVGRGTLAARPAFGTAGRLYYVTDDSTLYRDSGSAWESVEGAAAVAHAILSASHSDVDDADTPADADVLTWDATPGEWVAAPAPAAGSGASTALSYVTAASEATLSNETVLGTGVIATAAHASRPASSLNGRIFLPSDGYSLERDTGSVYAPWGPIFPFTPPVDGDFSWENQGGASVTAAKSAIFLRAPATAGGALRIRKKAAPTPPYVITAAFMPLSVLPAAGEGGSSGLLFRNSANSRIHAFYIHARTISGTSMESGWALSSFKYSDSSTFNASYLLLNMPWTGSVVWLRIADNNTNRVCSVSADGQNWVDVHSVTRLDYLLAIDEVGFFCQSGQATYDSGLTLLHWKQT